MFDVLTTGAGTVMAVVESGAWNGVTSAMMQEVLSEIKSLLPIVAPAVIGFIAFRKGWGFIKGAIKGA